MTPAEEYRQRAIEFFGLAVAANQIWYRRGILGLPNVSAEPKRWKLESDTMTMYRLLQSHAFEPETITLLAAAYEDTLRSLGLAERTDALTEIVAQKLIQLAQQGQRDPVQLRDRALKSLRA
jgi:hypothetical protein